MSLFDSLFGGGYQDAAQAQIQAIQTGQKQATGAYTQGRKALTDYGAAALAPNTQIFNSATGGANAYGDATGANGQAGFDRATTNFRADPGYNFALQQGEQAIDRGAAARSGGSDSGNLRIAEMTYGQGLADQQYGNYVSRLQPYLGQQSAAAGQIAQTNLATGGAVNTNYGNQGNLDYNSAVGIGNATAAADTATQNAENSFINGAIGLGTKLLGYSSGKGNLSSSVG